MRRRISLSACERLEPSCSRAEQEEVKETRHHFHDHSYRDLAVPAQYVLQCVQCFSAVLRAVKHNAAF